MSQKKLISIIIPAHNYADKLPRAISSVVEQLNEKHELIVINDGSTDNTQQVLQALQALSKKPFKIIEKENGGLASVRNRGIQEASSDYLIFLDADDELDTDALEYIEEHISHNPTSKMIIGGYTSISPEGERLRVSLPRKLPKSSKKRVEAYLIDKTISLANGATVMHKTLFERGVYPEHFRNAEDIPVFAQALANYKCTVLSESLALIHKHETSLRNNVDYDRAVGMALVDEVFSTKRLPDCFKSLKRKFKVQRALSLFRAFYMAGLNKEALDMYCLAVNSDWRAVFNYSYTTKYLRLLFRRHTDE